MKVKLKPPYELSDFYQSQIKWHGLKYYKEYELLSSNFLSIQLRRDDGVKMYLRKDLFNIIEENMPTKEQVLEAASTSKEAKDALVKLFPKYFEDDKYVDLTKESIGNFLCIRENGKYKHKGFYLVGQYDWEITKDDRGVLVLLPTKKVV